MSSGLVVPALSWVFAVALGEATALAGALGVRACGERFRARALAGSRTALVSRGLRFATAPQLFIAFHDVGLACLLTIRYRL